MTTIQDNDKNYIVKNPHYMVYDNYWRGMKGTKGGVQSKVLARVQD